MSTTQYHAFNINLSKDFLKKIHSHRLITEIKDIPEELYEQAWTNTPEVTIFRFGGIYNQQFTSFEEIEEFSKAFDSLLQRKSINAAHKDPLLYLIRFLEQDLVKQAIQQAQQNKLRDFSDFLSNLFINGYNHILNMEKNKDYVKLNDPYSHQIFFAKKDLAEKMDLEELAEYVPDIKRSDDIVKYLTVPIGKHQIHIPKEMIPLLASSSKLKSIDGETLPTLNFPRQLRRDLLKYTVDTMMEEHIKAQTELYHLFQSDKLDIQALRKLYKSYKKHKFSNVRALTRIGVIVSDYMIDNKLLKTKIDIADFLWEYLALFKAYELPKAITPDSYSELLRFYTLNDINKESIRLMMKDAYRFGDF